MKRLLLFILLSAQAFAVKTLTASVAFTDAQGNPCSLCYIVFNLSGPANLIAGGQIVNVPPITVTMGSAGFLISSQQIIANDEMQPTGTYYTIRIFNQNNVLVRGPENWILSGGSPIDLSLETNVAVPDPGLGSPVLQNPSAAQTITGQSLTLSSTAPLNAQGLAKFTLGVLPATAGGADVGSASLPFANLWFGAAATNNFKLTGTATAARVITAPDVSGTISYPVFQDCTTTTACANTVKSNWFIVRGDVTFPSATTVSLSQLPFTSAASFSCTASDLTTAAGVVNITTYTSGSAVTLTETGGTNTDHARYICTGF